jgi:hypothetical protein
MLAEDGRCEDRRMVSDHLQARRLKLLYKGVQLGGKEGYVELTAVAARAAGYEEVYGDDYYDVFELYLKWLQEKDGAVEVDVNHRGYGDVVGLVPYLLTDDGRRMLSKAGYSVDPS